MKKSLENMSTQELLNELAHTRQKTKITPKKFKTDEQGTILLNPNNPSDRAWMDDAEDGLI